MDRIDKFCVVFYYAIGPLVLLWLAAIVHTVCFFE